MQSADFLSAVFFYLKVGENLNQNWIVENLNNAFSTWNGKLGELWGLVTTGPQTFKGGAVWSVMQTLHNGMVGIGYALVVLFFAISLCKNTMNFHELKRPEAAIHYFLRFVAAKALVGYGMDIMLNVFSMPPPHRSHRGWWSSYSRWAVRFPDSLDLYPKNPGLASCPPQRLTAESKPPSK